MWAEFNNMGNILEFIILAKIRFSLVNSLFEDIEGCEECRSEEFELDKNDVFLLRFYENDTYYKILGKSDLTKISCSDTCFFTLSNNLNLQCID